MTSAMPTVDLAQSLLATRDLARDRSEEPGDAYDRLSVVCDELRSAITGANTTGGDPSREVERGALDPATAEHLRTELATLAHDRSEDRANDLCEQVRAVTRGLG